MNKLLIISGPTATGKTSLAFDIARQFKGELISADSRQVYRGMDIVTGKDLDREVKTWLLDVAEPNQPFTVADYQRLAWQAIEDIWKREKLPIVVGGTGFYIKALIDGIGTMGIKPDWEFRRKLETLTVDKLGKRLRKADPQRWEGMNESDRKNPRRLVRAIEIAQKLEARSTKAEVDSGQARMTSFWGGATATTPESSVLWIGLKALFPVLYDRIDQRVDERLKMGAVEETKQLVSKFGWDISSMTGQGYRELKRFIEGKISLEEAIKHWKFAEHKYARKQMTWFRKEKRAVGFDITTADFILKVEQAVEQWYTK